MPPGGSSPCGVCGAHCGAFSFVVGATGREPVTARSLACLEVALMDDDAMRALPRCAHCKQPAPASPCMACAQALFLAGEPLETVACPGCGKDVPKRPEGSCGLCGVVTDIEAVARDAMRARPRACTCKREPHAPSCPGASS